MRSIFIIEDHPIVSESLTAYFTDSLRWKVLGTASTLAEAKEKISKFKNIDALLMDIQLPDGWGIDIIPYLKEQNKKPTVLAVYTSFNDYSYVSASLKHGVTVYLTKRRNKDKLESAIINAFDGLICIDEEAQRNLDKVTDIISLLSSRELEVFVFIKRGLSNEEIAAKLNITPRTVGNIISCMLDKTGAKNRRELEKL